MLDLTVFTCPPNVDSSQQRNWISLVSGCPSTPEVRGGPKRVERAEPDGFGGRCLPAEPVQAGEPAETSSGSA